MAQLRFRAGTLVDRDFLAPYPDHLSTREIPVRLSIEDRCKRLIPGWLYYPYKIRKEAKHTEPELDLLHELVPPGSTAIDVGCNRGYYSYRLSKLAKQVEAFEPNPAMVAFARHHLALNVRIHEIALHDHDGIATLHVPYDEKGVAVHIFGSLTNSQLAPVSETFDVRTATLDSFDFKNVGFIKIDVEGSELAVMDGARHTIARDRPNLVVEVFGLVHPDPLGDIERITKGFDYDSFVLMDGCKYNPWKLLADPAVLSEFKTAAPKTLNAVFTPRERAAGFSP
jgi:FkbM family methyltransferase